MIEIDAVRFLSFGPFSLDVGRGEIVGLHGPSGAGKSLLLRAVADLDPHEGEVRLDGIAAAAMPAPVWRRKVGLLPSEPQWWGERVGEHFDEVARTEWIEPLGFDAGALDWEVAQLSSGERQRLGLARLLAKEPEVLLLDEPTANLDKENTTRVETLVRAADRPTVWVSHDLAQLERIADRRFRLDGGLRAE